MLQGMSATAVHRDSSGESLVATGLRFNLKAHQDPRVEENNLKMIHKPANAGANTILHLGGEPEGEWFGIFEFDV